MKLLLVPIFKVLVLAFCTIFDTVRWILLLLFHFRVPSSHFFFLSDGDDASNQLNMRLLRFWTQEHP